MIKTILLVDDSNASNQFNKVVLEEMGVAEQIIIKNSAERALEYLKGEENNNVPPLPELILLDIMMPQKDGFMFLDDYIKLGPEKTNDFQTKISLVSDFIDVDNYTRSQTYKMYGLIDQIRKPIEEEDILNLLEEHFE